MKFNFSIILFISFAIINNCQLASTSGLPIDTNPKLERQVYRLVPSSNKPFHLVYFETFSTLKEATKHCFNIEYQVEQDSGNNSVINYGYQIFKCTGFAFRSTSLEEAYNACIRKNKQGQFFCSTELSSSFAKKYDYP